MSDTILVGLNLAPPRQRVITGFQQSGQGVRHEGGTESNCGVIFSN
ncbi:hypothetical protein HLH44_17080 [Gluconacetobacter sp. 1c LMG 22058]|uniref:Uncharacterized protein n=1 Tax=Gluconacetobacter dulcium TaxID=2729096 RepID=A0A7W4PIT6_9PROT|nr:hypothetical protein [Gluconacetobacter dulcium]MBB2199135.1 hypothetical protein [Gluconacetobacter dulcium]